MTVKGQEYAMFAASAGAHQATYAAAGRSSLAEAAGITGGARVSDLSEEGATVSWRTGSPTTTSVRVGSGPETLALTHTAADRTRTHRVTLGDLKPGQRYRFRVVSEDASGTVHVWPARNRPSASFRTRPADRTAPTLRGLRATSLPDGTAAVTWRTDERSTSRVRFGSDRSRLDRVGRDDTLTRRHRVVLTGLDAGRSYWLNASSTDRAGNSAEASRVVRLRTVGAGVADQTAAEFSTGTSTGRLAVSPADLGALTLRGPGTGTHTSAVVDSAQKVTWRRAVLRASLPAGSRVTLFARAGSRPVPDGSWSAWARADGPLRLAGRYLQYRVVLSATGAEVPSVGGIGFTHTGGRDHAPGEAITGREVGSQLQDLVEDWWAILGSNQ